MGTSQIVELVANFKMAATAQLVKFFSRKRKAVHSFQRLNDEEARRIFTEELDFETEVAQVAALSAILLRKKPRQERGRNELRDNNWWAQGYRNWDGAGFKKRLRVFRDTFEFILAEIKNDMVKQPTLMKPHPTPPATQLAKCLYRLVSKKNECDLDNIQLIIMTCIVLHNIRIQRNDPCKSRWRLEVNELSLIPGTGQGGDAGTTREAIANWLWQIREERAAIH